MWRHSSFVLPLILSLDIIVTTIRNQTRWRLFRKKSSTNFIRHVCYITVDCSNTYVSTHVIILETYCKQKKIFLASEMSSTLTRFITFQLYSYVRFFLRFSGDKSEMWFIEMWEPYLTVTHACVRVRSFAHNDTCNYLI